MKIKNFISKRSLANFLMKFRIKTDHSTIITFSALMLILFIAFVIRLFPLRWEIQTGSIHLSEFDPYFQYRFTEHIVKNGFISWAWPNQWVDMNRWYPDGINVARFGYIGLPFTAAFLYDIVSALGVSIKLMDFCALFPAIMGMLTCFAIYFLGKDIGGKSVGLLAALFLALSPSYIQRTSFGFFDDETIGIFALVLFAFLFLRANEEGRQLKSTVIYSLVSGVALGYFCSGWGAAYYPINMVVLLVVGLIFMKKYSRQLLFSYSLTFGLGLFLAMNVPKNTLNYIITFPILPVVGVFILLGLSEVFQNITSTRSKIISLIVFLVIIVGGFAVLWRFGYMTGVAGKFISVLNPFTREGSPLIESVAEHRITAWGSIYYDFGIGIIFFIGGLFFIIRNLNTRNLFLLIFSITSLYFATSMVRLLVLMAPAFALLAAVGISGLLKPFNTLFREPKQISSRKKYGMRSVGKEFSGVAVFLIFLILMTSLAFPMPKVYRQAFAPITVTAGSLPIVPNEPVREWLDALAWMQSYPTGNLPAGTAICSWWDYGYWITVLGNQTSLADNATINGTQIENVGFIYMTNETNALKMLKRYDAKYILVFTTFDTSGNWLGFGDEGKWMWMARISGQARDRFVLNGFVDENKSWIDETPFGSYSAELNKWVWNEDGMDSTIYKLLSWGKHQWCIKNGVRDPEEDAWYLNGLDSTDVEPKYFKKAFFSGLNLNYYDASINYGGVVPLVCLYEIDWQKYNLDYPNQ